MRTSVRTECPGKNRRRGEQKFVTAEDVLPLVADIAGKPKEYFVCPTWQILAPSEVRVVGNLHKEVKFDIVTRWVISS